VNRLRLLIDTIGMIAATLTTLCWLPQTLKILRTRDTPALFLMTQTAFAFGIALWFVFSSYAGR
jgi:MtN3 and saliva related transmembrane protein